jgi:hypothetical protein
MLFHRYLKKKICYKPKIASSILSNRWGQTWIRFGQVKVPNMFTWHCSQCLVYVHYGTPHPGIVYSLHLLFSKQASTERSSLAPSSFIFLEHYNFQGHMECGNAKRNQRPLCVQLWWAVQAQFSKVCRFGQFRVCYTWPVHLSSLATFKRGVWRMWLGILISRSYISMPF